MTASFLFYRDDTRGERSALLKGGEKMNESLARILVSAKEMDKWVPVNFLVKYDIQQVNLLDLEDQGLLLVNQSKTDGLLLKLTLIGYHHFR